MRERKSQPHSKIYLLFTSLLALSLCSLANAEIHRYKDASGKWHYTDDLSNKRAVESEKIELGAKVNVVSSHTGKAGAAVVVPDEVCQSDIDRGPFFWNLSKGTYGIAGKTEFTKEGTSENPSYYFDNSYFAPVAVTFKLTESTNIKSTPSLPLQITVPPHTKIKLAELEPTSDDVRWRYRYHYNFQIGELNPTHDEDCRYIPPVQPGKAYYISQAFNGNFSHSSRASMYAVDIGMPIGTDVLAARGGLIIEQKKGNVQGGIGKSYYDKANLVRILHADGTIATYGHLQFASLNFSVGKVVHAGEVIGKSGNTGYSSGPHLHFVVHANRNMRRTSVPFKFYSEGNIFAPERGMRVSSSGDS